jgi:2-methylcitrate dehydratase PrpD
MTSSSSHDTESATALLGSFAAAPGLIPSNVREKAAFCLLDVVGLSLLAHDERTTLAVQSLLTSLTAETAGTARVWCSGACVPVSEAVFANSVAAHAQFHDDTDYSSWTHPGSLIVPLAVSLADSRDASIEEALDAIVVGYDAIEWLGADAEVGRALIERGVRTSPTLGTVAAAAAAANLLGLNAEQATSAIGIASSITGGVLETVRSGSDEWRIQNGRAASGGLLAAELARNGVQGAPMGLEGPKGLARSLAGLTAPPARWKRTPRIDAILGVSAKPWATLGDNMSAVVAAKILHDRGVDAEQIRRIRIRIWRHFTEYPGTSYRGPFDRIGQALASMAFGTACMLTYGELEYDKSVAHRTDSKILELIHRVEIEPDDHGDPYKADVEVTLSDGSVVKASASEAPATQLFHDRATAVALFEARLLRTGYRKGIGSSAAHALLEVIDRRAGTGMRGWIDSLSPSKR